MFDLKTLFITTYQMYIKVAATQDQEQNFASSFFFTRTYFSYYINITSSSIHNLNEQNDKVQMKHFHFNKSERCTD